MISDMGRPSHVRDAVEALIGNSARHDWSADEVLAALGRSGVAANQSSVFRALSRLESDGVVWRVDLGDGVARFERAGQHHEHVRCQECGAVSAVPGCAVDALRPLIEQATGFRLTGHSVVFSGLCGECRSGEAS
jgi:Fe2+ or Zn2+ uptake regulation protein